MLHKQDIEIYKKKLLGEQEDLKKQITRLESPSDFGDEPGESDETQESAEDINNRESAQMLRDGLIDIEHALEKIEKGTYGIDEKTGEEIPKDALDANPVIRFHPDSIKKERD